MESAHAQLDIVAAIRADGGREGSRRRIIMRPHKTHVKTTNTTTTTVRRFVCVTVMTNQRQPDWSAMKRPHARNVQQDTQATQATQATHTNGQTCMHTLLMCAPITRMLSHPARSASPQRIHGTRTSRAPRSWTHWCVFRAACARFCLRTLRVCLHTHADSIEAVGQSSGQRLCVRTLHTSC